MREEICYTVLYLVCVPVVNLGPKQYIRSLQALSLTMGTSDLLSVRLLGIQTKVWVSEDLKPNKRTTDFFR